MLDSEERTWSDNFSRIVFSQEYADAWQAMVEAPLSFEEFSQLPMPQGCEPAELWCHFAILRRRAGFDFAILPWFHTSLDVSWAYITKQTVRELAELSSLAHPSSSLNVSLGATSIVTGLLEFVAEEAVAACGYDGVDITLDDARAIILLGHEPDTREEKIVSNFVRLFRAADSYASRPLSLALLDRIYEELVDGVQNIDEFKRSRVISGNAVWTERVKDRTFIERMMSASLAHANEALTMHDVIVSFHEMSSVLGTLDYFPQLNNLAELALRRIFFVYMKVPVLSFVPFLHLILESGVDFYRDYEIEMEALPASAAKEVGLDASLNFAGYVHTLLKGINDIQKQIISIEETKHETLERYHNDRTLNQRQKDFLTMASQYADYSITVKQYGDLFGVSCGTARTDLQGLETRSILEESVVDRAIVFRLP